MICSYCKTESVNPDACSFCEADLTKERPVINPYLDDRASTFSQPELEKLHTYDLMLVLRHIRAERTNMYKTMQIVRKAPVEAQKSVQGYAELKDDGISMYREITAKKNVIEQILVDRMGYFPLRIDNKLLEAFQSKINRHKT